MGFAPSRTPGVSKVPPEARHLVRAGETLWSIAEAHYAGDPRKAIWRIEQRNGLAGAEALRRNGALPAAVRRS